MRVVNRVFYRSDRISNFRLPFVSDDLTGALRGLREHRVSHRDVGGGVHRSIHWAGEEGGAC